MAAVLTLAVTIPAGLLLSRASRVAGIAAKGELVVLQPQEWLGQHFPLVPYINLGDLLLKGQWEVLLYHSNCPDCETALAGMARRSTIGATEEPRRAAVAVPPYGTTGNAVDDRGRIARGKLSEELDWFVETPLLVSLADGKVVSVRAGKSVLTGDVAQFNAEAIDNRATSGSDP
jgi:hypothetical protein